MEPKTVMVPGTSLCIIWFYVMIFAAFVLCFCFFCYPSSSSLLSSVCSSLHLLFTFFHWDLHILQRISTNLLILYIFMFSSLLDVSVFLVFFCSFAFIFSLSVSTIAFHLFGFSGLPFFFVVSGSCKFWRIL